MRNNKYYNKINHYKGKKFASLKEKNRFIELEFLEERNLITNLSTQPSFVLQDKFTKNGKAYRAVKYISDFKYYDNEKQKWIVEDVKSPATKTTVYNIKKKLFELKFNDLEITEI